MPWIVEDTKLSICKIESRHSLKCFLKDYEDRNKSLISGEK